MDQRILEWLSAVTPEEQEILEGRAVIDRSLYMDGSRDVISGEKLLPAGKLIAVRPHTRFIAFPEHSHDYVEMVYMCRGTTIHRVNGRKLELREGELLMLGQNARQSIEPAGADDLAVNLIIRPAFFDGTLPFLGEEPTPLRSFISDCLCGAGAFLHFQVSDVLPVQNLMENLLWVLLSDLPNKRGLHQMTMGLLFTHLLSCTERLSVASDTDETLLNALRYVEEHYREGSLGALSEKLHFEPSTMTRLLKRKTGKTFTELIQEKRMSQAAWLLRNTERNVEEIAHSVGYENLSYFFRLFSTHFGATPRQYRLCK